LSVLAPLPQDITPDKPPGTELGAVTQQVGGIHGWASFVDEQEYVPELSWPSSIQTYHRMRSDSQVEALHLGTVQPIREFRWSIDPNKAPANLAEQVAADLGLPLLGHEDDAVPRGPRQFTFDTFLDDALLAPLYGHFYFEIVGDSQPDAWHMTKLSPRHPRTLQEFATNNVGDLLAIRQNIGGAAGWFRLPPPIPAGKLVSLVWRPEAGSHVGRSMLRSLYREWLVKDRTIRVAAINIERAGGMPVVEGPNGASDQQLQDLARLARSFKVAEGGGGAIPFGSKLHLVGGNTPDAIALLQYCDEAMARVWALMLVQLGMTATGNRALGAEFAIYAARAQRALAKWVIGQVNTFLDRYTEWNLGPGAKYAPLLHFEQAKPDALSLADMVALIGAGALTVDPELEGWIRSESGLPERPANAPAPPAADGTGAKLPTPINEPQVDQPTIAAAPPPSLAINPLPDRTLRRQPNQHEIMARTDFRTLDSTHQSVFAALETAWRQQVIPAQISAIGDQIVTTKAGTPRQRVTKAAMAAINAPNAGVDELGAALLQAAKDGGNAALAEMAAQGAIARIPADEQLAASVADQVNAVVSMAANGISLAAQRKASALVGGGRTAQDVRAAVTSHLSGLRHQWTTDQLKGAVTMAQNTGRAGVFATVDQDAMSYYASELLDANTCDPCMGVDGTQYDTLDEAEQDYAAGGYVDCDGGPRCRGTIVATYQEANADSSASPDLALVGA
jgi:hypothetical protein